MKMVKEFKEGFIEGIEISKISLRPLILNFHIIAAIFVIFS